MYLGFAVVDSASNALNASISLESTLVWVPRGSNGRFTVLRQTIRKRLLAKLSEVKTELRRRMHDPIPAMIPAWRLHG